MGWTYFELNEKPSDWFVKEWNSEHYEVLKVAIVQLRELYAAVKDKKTNKVFCVVYLLDYNSRSFYNFGYKGMDETAGPYVFNCPESVFKLLTELDENDDANGYAKEWREKVREKLKTKEAVKNNQYFKTRPLTFSNGRVFEYFKKEGKKIFGGVVVNGEFHAYCQVKINLARADAKPIELNLVESI